MAGKRVVWGLGVLSLLLFVTCSLGTDIETLRGRVQKDKTYTVSFESNGGSIVSSQTVNSGGTATRPTDPTRSGYTFNNWYSDLTLTTVYSFSTAVTSNITLYARWNSVSGTTYIVSFESNGGSGVSSQTLSPGSTATRPANPSRSGYTFDNWYSDFQLTTVYNFSSAVTGNITLYAKWNSVSGTTYTVSFDSNGGSSVSSQTVNSGGTATRPADPAKSGYTFGNWYSNTGLTTVYNFSTAVTGNITLYAKWNDGTPADPTRVTSGADSGPGTLRYAIENAAYGSTIVVDSGVGTIRLERQLSIGYQRQITIDGNGVTLTRGTVTWTTETRDAALLVVEGVVSINRIHFKDGSGRSLGGAIWNCGVLTLESCIFSGNQASGTYSYGGAIYNYTGTVGTPNGTMPVALIAKGCTFYGNSSEHYGGAIYSVGELTLIGNLFYGNTGIYGPIVKGDATSLGYNVVDVPYGTGNNQCGWYAVQGDKPPISALPFSTTSFRLLPGSGALNVIATLPQGYPTVDFYGNPITNGAAAGAVQSTVSGTGFNLDLSANDTNRGSVNVSPALNADGLVSGTVTLTASAQTGYAFSYWLVDGIQYGNVNPLTLTINRHTRVQAILGRVVLVTNFTDDMFSMTTQGTLRRALADAQNFDIIRFSGVTAGQTTVKLNERLEIKKSVTIEGNGVTLTRDSAWTTVDDNSQLMLIRNGNGSGITIIVNRVHFKDGKANASGTAFHHSNNDGYLTLESCIFSGNQSNGYSYGGAIFNSGNLKIKGCTFYGNSSNMSGGVIYDIDGTLTFEGNLFFGNVASNSYPVVYYEPSGTVTSLGYNVVDIPLGIEGTQSGWEPAATDKTISELPFSTADFKPLADGGAVNVITTLPDGYPAVDFYGKPITNGAAAGAVQP